MKIFSIALAAGLALASAAFSDDYTIGDLVISQPVARETTKTAMSSAGYLSITNEGSSADRLIAVEAGFPRVMIHDTEMTDGVARMMHIEAVEIPPGQTIKLAPGGKHVMFMGLAGDPFEMGEKIPATLVFEKSGRLDILFTVGAINGPAMNMGNTPSKPAAPQADHSNMKP